MLKLWFLTLIFWISRIHVDGGYHKFDLKHLPYDLKPVSKFVGRWQYERIDGYGSTDFPFGKIIEFGIDPLPHFGARCLNYTATTYHDWQRSEIYNSSKVIHYEYGYLPVNNRTKNNPQILCAFLTTGSEGYAMIEYGMVVDDTILLDLNKYLSRSFGLGFRTNFFVNELHRQFRIWGNRMEQRILAQTSLGISDFTVSYLKTVT
uniref:THAP4-like heme-binding beta-barrel domain-containing protein n=1 Tax=Romanomermis culicivorax TaxID=13658 RepID=A0A915KIH4_ROMCU